MTQPELAKAASIGLSTVVDFERERRQVSVDTQSAIKHALEDAGVEFTNGLQPGVRIKAGMEAKKPTGPATDAVQAMDAAISENVKAKRQRKH